MRPQRESKYDNIVKKQKNNLNYYNQKMFPMFPTSENMANIDNTYGERRKTGKGRISNTGVDGINRKYKVLNRMYLRSEYIRITKPEKTHGSEFKRDLNKFAARIKARWLEMHNTTDELLATHNIITEGLNSNDVVAGILGAKAALEQGKAA